MIFLFSIELHRTSAPPLCFHSLHPLSSTFMKPLEDHLQEPSPGESTQREKKTRKNPQNPHELAEPPRVLQQVNNSSP